METQEVPHRLFQDFPLSGEVSLSTGPAPTPYHVYDGHLMLIGGTADLVVAQKLCASEDVSPIPTEDGRALIALWIGDFTRASLDPHTELQLSIVVSRQPQSPASAHTFGLLKLITENPQAKMLCHGLWNNTEQVVAYNSEHLGLQAARCHSEITINQETASFIFQDTDGQPLVRGQVRHRQRPEMSAMLSLMRLIGFKQSMALAKQEVLEASVVNRKGTVLAQNAEAKTYTAAELILQSYKPGPDQITVHAPAYEGLDFRPGFVEHMKDVNFLYCDPQQQAL